MYTLPSTPIDRNDSFPDDIVDRVIGTDSTGADISLSDLDSDDLAKWLGRLDRSQPLDESDIPAERYMMPLGLAEFLANPPCALD